MHKFYTLLFCLTAAFAASAQTGSVRGRLIDSIGKQSLKDASVVILESKDSTLETYSLAKDDGSFELKNIPQGTYIVQATFQGYSPFFKKVQITKDNLILNVGTIYMKIKEKELDEVVVTQSPVVMKHDTIEYNAGSFKVNPGANVVVEDLLKKMPGMSVDNSGNVSHAGEQVQRVLVDGKRFFGDDPRMATKNLPPDVVDKIQVFDDLSDQSKFSGFDDGNRVKTINITTKKDKRKGYFGKVNLGAGEDSQGDGDLVYDNMLNLSRYNGNSQLTLLGQGNNVNKQNFTPQNILGGSGGGGGRGGGGGGTSTGTGITTTWAGGGNYHNTWGKANPFDFAGSYFYNSQKNVNSTKTNTQNFLTGSKGADSSNYTDALSSGLSNKSVSSVNFNIEPQLDSSNSMIIRPSFTYQEGDNFSNQSSTKYLENHIDTVYNTASKSSSESNGYNSSVNATFRHKFKTKGRTYSINVTGGRNENNSSGDYYSDNSYFVPTKYYKNVDQQYNSATTTNSLSTTLSYTEPTFKNQLIEFKYNYSYNKNEADTKTFNYNGATQGFDLLDSALSNKYDNTYFSNTATINYRVQKTKYNFMFGSGLQFGNQTSNNLSKDYTIKRNYVNPSPSFNFTYNFSKTKSLRVFYNGNTGQPSVSQLQPIVATSDSINFTVGNPNLKQQFTHSFRVLYHSFDVVTQQLVFATINASVIQNDIQSSVVNLKGAQYNAGSQITSYTNLNGTVNINGTFSYGFPLRTPKSNLTFTTNASYAQSQNLIDSASNFARNTSIGEKIGWTTNLKDNFDVNVFSTSTYNIAKQTLNTRSNANTFQQQVGVDFTYFTKNGFLFANNFTYSYTGGLSAGYNASVPLWNASIAKQFFKNKAGELKFYVFDLLNQNKSATRTSSGTGIVDTQSKVLTRYFMLSFTYSLRKFGAQDQKMPGMFRGMRGDGGQGPGGGMNMIRRMNGG
ncbi:outer membrane beta-barrel protein [Chitinophagaceae bacterium LWZ2-11]